MPIPEGVGSYKPEDSLRPQVDTAGTYQEVFLVVPVLTPDDLPVPVKRLTRNQLKAQQELPYVEEGLASISRWFWSLFDKGKKHTS